MSRATRQQEQAYNLRGLNMVKPDQIIDSSPISAGQSPHAYNSRIYAPETEPRTAISMRKGASFYSIPIGESLSTQNTTTTGQTAAPAGYLPQLAQSFVAGASRRLTKIELLMQDNTSNDIVIVSVHEDSSGSVGNQIAISSVQGQNIGTSYAYTPVRFVQAPLLTSGSTYWIVVHTQELQIGGNYSVSQTTTGSGLLTSPDAGSTWTSATGSINYKTYLSDDALVLWQRRYVKNDGTKQTVFAVGGSSPAIYYVSNEGTGATTQIVSGLNTNATRYRSEIVAGVLYIVNGYDPVIKWDGTTVTRIVHDTNFLVPSNIILHKNRVFYINKDNPTRPYFSNLAPDYDTITSVNFFYVPDPSHPDNISGWVVNQDQLVIFTKETKYTLLGDDLSSFRLNQSPAATHGAVSQEAICAGESRVYFWSIDGGPYVFDGGIDRPLGVPIDPEVRSVTNHEKMDAVVRDKEWRIYYQRLGDSTHQHMLIFDISYGEWFIDTETYTRSPSVRSLESNELIEGSSVVGAVYLGENENAQLGCPIDWQYWTNYKKYTSGIARDRIRTFRAIFQSPDASYSVRVGKDSDFDNSPKFKYVYLEASGILYDGGALYNGTESFYGLGTRVAQPRVSLSGRANNTQYRFQKYGAHTRVFLYGYEALIKSGRMR